MLVHHVVDLEPDLVLFYDGLRDISSCTYFDKRIGYPAAWVVLERALRGGDATARQLRDALLSLSTWRLLLSGSEIAKRIDPSLAIDAQLQIALVEAEQETHPTPPVDAVADHLLVNWDKMRRVSQAFGAEFIAVLQPANPVAREEPRFKEYYDRLDTQIGTLRDEGAMYYSFDRLFDDRPDTFYDPVHTTDVGHEAIAASLAEIIRSQDILVSLR